MTRMMLSASPASLFLPGTETLAVPRATTLSEDSDSEDEDGYTPPEARAFPSESNFYSDAQLDAALAAVSAQTTPHRGSGSPRRRTKSSSRAGPRRSWNLSPARSRTTP